MIRKRGNSFLVEVYDPTTRTKQHVSARKLGMKPPRTMREAQALEREAYKRMEDIAPHQETVDHFAGRWMEDFTDNRSESTIKHNRERIGKAAEDFRGRTFASVTRQEAEAWALRNRSRVREVRAMWNDAIRVGVARDNPFKGIGYARKGRTDIEVLTPSELDELCACAVRAHGPAFGQEMAALIRWAAYTGMRPGEIMAARWGNLREDTYNVTEQFNTKLGKVTAPKHGSVGEIYVPPEAKTAVVSKPRVIDDDLMFHTKSGRMFSAVTLREAWVPIRAAFGRPDLDLYELRHFCASHMLNELQIEPWIIAKQMRHSDDGALVLRLYGHPDRKRALGRIRLAYDATGEAQGGVGHGDSAGETGRDLYA